MLEVLKDKLHVLAALTLVDNVLVAHWIKRKISNRLGGGDEAPLTRNISPPFSP